MVGKFDVDSLWGGEIVKFGAVVGNPPYQDQNNQRNRDDSIFHQFLEMGLVAAKDCYLLTPARFLQNAGSTPKQWNEQILESKHFEVCKFYPNSKQVFQGVDIKGGILISRYALTVQITPIRVFIPYKELRTIFDKVRKMHRKDTEYLTDYIYAQTKFNLQALYANYPQLQKILGANGKERRITSSIFAQLDEVFHEKKQSSKDVKIYGRQNNQRVYKYVDKKYLDVQENFYDYKVMIPAANGSGTIGEALVMPVIGYPLVGHSQTFISLGKFSTKYEVQACLKYVKTKFFRALLGIRKTTQNNKNPLVWSCIPIQNFTEQSDINWDCSIVEIDQQLYRKYGLSKAEIRFIETNVQVMK